MAIGMQILQYKCGSCRPLIRCLFYSPSFIRYPSSRAYITARITAAGSKLPEAERHNITDMMVSLATAEHHGMDCELEARLEAMCLNETEKKQPVGQVGGWGRMLPELDVNCLYMAALSV